MSEQFLISDIKIVGRGKINTRYPNTLIHDHSLSWLDTLQYRVAGLNWFGGSPLSKTL